MARYAFISYASQDRGYVENLAQELRKLGVVTWIDRLGITSGRRWRNELRDAIDNCDAFVSVMSPESERSKWVEEELSRAEAMHKPIFPLLLAGKPFFGLAGLQYEDVTGGSLPPTRFMRSIADALSAPAEEAQDRRSPLISRFAARLVDTIEYSKEPVQAIVWLRSNLVAANGGDNWTVWDVSNAPARQHAVYPSNLAKVTWSYGDQLLLAGHPRSNDGRPISNCLVVMDTAGGERRRFTTKGMLWDWSWRPDYPQIALAAGDDAIVWDSRSGEVVARIASTRAKEVRTVAWSPDGSLLATGHSWKTGDVHIWNVESDSEMARFVPRQSAHEPNTLVNWLNWGSRADVLLVGLYSSPYLAPVEYNLSEIWNPITTDFVSNISETPEVVARRDGLALCAERSLLALIDPKTQKIVVRDLYDREARITVMGDGGGAKCVAWNADGDALATGYSDGRLRIWS